MEEFVIVYLIYAILMVAVFWFLSSALIKIERLNVKERVLKDLIKGSYETDNIDLNNFLK